MFSFLRRISCTNKQTATTSSGQTVSYPPTADTSVVPLGSNLRRRWEGTVEDSWDRTLPSRPRVFDNSVISNELVARALQQEHDVSNLTEYNVKKGLITTAMAGDANQKITQDNLSERCMSIHNYIKLLEDTIDRLDQDTEVLQNRKQR
uniref:Uncharacterized protein n=1 Tax=Cacopsylla melanoneura TaxID=428564 RepID=A0A8D8THD4_9HEMI